jgi:hypothetical protein
MGVDIGPCSAHREAVADHLGLADDDFLAAAADLHDAARFPQALQQRGNQTVVQS